MRKGRRRGSRGRGRGRRGEGDRGKEACCCLTLSYYQWRDVDGKGIKLGKPSTIKQLSSSYVLENETKNANLNASTRAGFKTHI